MKIYMQFVNTFYNILKRAWAFLFIYFFFYIQLIFFKYCYMKVQFSISHLFAHSLFYLTISGATTPGQSGPGSNGYEGVLCIPQIS